MKPEAIDLLNKARTLLKNVNDGDVASIAESLDDIYWMGQCTRNLSERDVLLIFEKAVNDEHVH